MTSLTRMIADVQSPVAQWMRETFPDTRSLSAEIRAAAGSAAILPAERIAYTTQGGAIDWWLRFLASPDEVPDLGVAYKGLDALEGTAAYDAGWPMFATVTGLSIGDSPKVPIDPPIDPMRQLLSQDDENQARTCYMLSLLTECFRAGVRPGSRLLEVPSGSSPQALLDLATEAEVADLVAMRVSAQQVFLSRLATEPVWTGPTFDGSRDLAADADLIVGDTLIEIKATIGGPPRKDGTRAAIFDRDDLYQVLGYLLMDYSDRYEIRQVGVYLPRFKLFHTWSVTQFLQVAAGRPIDLVAAREAFRHVLRDRLPSYLG